MLFSPAVVKGFAKFVVCTSIVAIAIPAFAASSAASSKSSVKKTSASQAKPVLRSTSSSQYLSTDSASSYSSRRSGVRLGVQGGMSMANATMKLPEEGMKSPDFANRSSFVLGLGADFPFSPYFALRSELNYVGRGAVLEDGSANSLTTTTRTVALNYLEIPVLLKAGYPIGQGFRPYVLMGPSVAFRVSAMETTQSKTRTTAGTRANAGTSTDSSTSTDVGDLYKSVDALMHVGAGMEFPVAGHWSAMVDGRYMVGLVNILKDPTEGVKTQTSIRNYAFQVVTGLQYEL